MDDPSLVIRILDVKVIGFLRGYKEKTDELDHCEHNIFFSHSWLLFFIFPCMENLTGWTTKNVTEVIIGILMRRQTHVGLSNWEYKEALFECVQENEVASGVLALSRNCCNSIMGNPTGWGTIERLATCTLPSAVLIKIVQTFISTRLVNSVLFQGAACYQGL